MRQPECITGLEDLDPPIPADELARLEQRFHEIDTGVAGQPMAPLAVGANSVLYFAVSDIEATHAACVARGATNERAPQLAARMPDHELWIGFLRDPDGNLVGLLEERR